MGPFDELILIGKLAFPPIVFLMTLIFGPISSLVIVHVTWSPTKIWPVQLTIVAKYPGGTVFSDAVAALIQGDRCTGSRAGKGGAAHIGAIHKHGEVA